MRLSPVARGSVGPTSSVGARLGLSVAALALASGCLDYQFRVVKPESTKEVKRAVAAAKPTPVDILFVVDNSGSMADEQANLARNFSQFINVLTQGAGNDYQIAVVTTDVLSEGGERAGDVTNVFSTDAPYFAIRGTDGSDCGFAGIEHGCFRGGSMKVVRSSMPAGEQISAFQQNVRVGSCGDGRELAMQAMALALENTRPGRCNAGFLRSDANLVVVIVSDEENARNDDVNDFARALVDAKGSAERVRVALIVGSKDGEPANCGATDPCGQSACQGTPPPGSMNSCGGNARCADPNETCSQEGRCITTASFYQRYQFNAVSPAVGCQSCSFFNTPDCCSAVAGTQYIQFARAVERRVNMADPGIAITQCKGSQDQRVACLVASICEAEFGETLIRIARDLVISPTFALDPPAKYPPGVVVEVNGTPLVNCASVQAGQECGFTVTPNGGSLSLRVQPAETDKVEVFFVVDE